jgi:DNA polymerase-3 subunit beta
MPTSETEVEKPAVQGAAMEITVSRQDLVRELTATQSVVERKTTIPILSNFLLEAEDDRLNITATDLDQAIRTSAQTLRLHQAAARWRHLHQAA